MNFIIQTNYSFFINLGVLFFILLTILAQNYTPKNYRWQEKTLSDLAIQGYKNAWIMKLGFIIFGLFITLGFFTKFIETNNFYKTDFLMIVYGISMIFSGVFSTTTKEEKDFLKKTYDIIHSSLAYFSGIILAVTMVFFAIKTEGSMREIHTMFLILSGIVSIFFSLSKTKYLRLEHGIIQRLLISVGLVWILLNYNLLTI